MRRVVSKDPLEGKTRKPVYNRTWRANHLKIRNAYVNLMKELKRSPTLDEIGKRSGIGVRGVQKHMKELTFEPSINPVRSLTPDILAAMAQAALRGKAADRKLYMQIVEGWREKQEVEVSGEILIDIEDEDQPYPVQT